MNNPAEAVRSWLRAGAEVTAGLLLFSQMSSNRRLPALVKINPPKYRPLLIKKLCALAGVEPLPDLALPRRRLRDDVPFLREPDCPAELKVLVADKITVYERYVQAHECLYDCTTLEKRYLTAREAIVNFQENRAIFAELDHYRETHTLLGRHRIFDQMREQRRLRSLNIVELIAQQRRLKSAIWRIDDEIRKGTKPHLLTEREQRRQHKMAMLKEVEKMIATTCKLSQEPNGIK